MCRINDNLHLKLKAALSAAIKPEDNNDIKEAMKTLYVTTAISNVCVRNAVKETEGDYSKSCEVPKTDSEGFEF